MTGEVLALLRQGYAYPHRLEPPALLEAALGRLSEQYPAVLYREDRSGGRPWITLHAGDEQLELYRRDAETMGALEPTLGRVARFVEGALGAPAAAGGEPPAAHMLRGLLSGLDAHTRLFTPRQYEQFQGMASGSFGGVGLVVSQGQDVFTVLAVLEGAPGAEAGILPGDDIVEIRQRSTIGMTIEEAVDLLRGEPGRAVRLALVRPGESEPRQFELVRRRLTIGSVDSQLLDQGGGASIGYVRLIGFQPTTHDDLRIHLDRLAMKRPSFSGLILDLRNNPGGIMDQAIRVADLFLERGVIVKTVRTGGESFVAEARGYRSIVGVPLIVLIDRDSASAAEIVAAALKNNRRAVLIGARSFGKGTVQSVYPLAGGYALKLTMARYFTPGDRSIQWIGVTPHVALVPARLGDRPQAIDLLPVGVDREPGRERGGFGEDGFPPEPALATVHYLTSQPPGRGGVGLPLPRDAERRRELLAADPVVRLARRVLARNGKRGYPFLLETALAEAAEAERRGQSRIAGELAARGIQWREVPRDKEAAVAVERVEVLTRKGDEWRLAGDEVLAGEEVRIAVWVRNTGPTSVGRTLVVIRGREGGIPTLQVPVGYLAPGDRAQAVFEFATAHGAGSRLENLVLIVREGTRKLLQRRVFLKVRAERPPALEVAVDFSETTGNGDGRAQAGETLTLSLQVRNRGRSRGLPGWAVLAADEEHGIVLLRTRVPLKTNAPGDTGRASFTIRLDREAAGRLPLRLRIVARRWGAPVLDTEIELIVNQPLPVLRLAPPVIHVALPRLAVTERSIPLRGAVSDDGAVREVFVRVNGRKVLYLSGAEEPGGAAGTLDFAIAAELEPGYNEIIVVARDDENLVARHVFAVWRGELDGLPLAGSAQARGQ